MSNTLHFSLRWWHWLLLVTGFVLLVLLTVLLALRSHGQHQYQRVLSGLKAQGKLATVDDFIEHAPPVDIQVQEAWDRWMKHNWNFPPEKNGISTSDRTWLAFVSGQGPVPSAVLTQLEDNRTQAEEARALVRTGHLTLSALGWLAQDAPPGKRTLPKINYVRTPNLLCSSALATFLHQEACTATDPAMALTELDQLHAAFARPGLLIDAMIAFAIARIRDDAYLQLRTLGRLPPSHQQRWLAEPSPYYEWLAAGFDGERLMSVDAMARWADETSLPGSLREMTMLSSFGSGGSAWWDPEWIYTGPWFWSTAHMNCAVSAAFDVHVSARLRGERVDPLPSNAEMSRRYWGYGALLQSSLMDCGITAIEADAAHRFFRLGVGLIADAKGNGLPVDHAALLTHPEYTTFISPPPDHLHLRYERLAQDRFRIAVDPASPVSDFDDPTRMPERTKALGTPPSKLPLVTWRNLEVQISPALLPPTSPAP